MSGLFHRSVRRFFIQGRKIKVLTGSSGVQFAIAAPSPSARAEGDSGVTVFPFTVTRSGETQVAASANWTVTGAGGAPANSSDFAVGGMSGTVDFIAGQTTATINIQVKGDTSVETNEGFQVTLSSPTVGTVMLSGATATITNDDALSEVGVVPAVLVAAGLGAMTPTRRAIANAAFSASGTGSSSASTSSAPLISLGFIPLGSSYGNLITTIPDLIHGAFWEYVDGTGNHELPGVNMDANRQPVTLPAGATALRRVLMPAPSVKAFTISWQGGASVTNVTIPATARTSTIGRPPARRSGR
jgi:hypothetical protein